MYKIKRFSYYEEREFGLIEDLRHSGLHRTFKKHVGKARKSLTKKIDKSIEKDLEKTREAWEVSY